jgi:hypothetical protein
VTGSFSAINGTVTITVNGLSEIKYIAIFDWNSDHSIAMTAIDLTGDTPYCVADEVYKILGFEGSASAVSGNTFTYKWNSQVDGLTYEAYGK